MTNDEASKLTPKGRMPGRYLVYGFLGFGVLFFTFMFLLAQRLDSAADRFHRGEVPTQK